jgi:hypothetical protein
VYSIVLSSIPWTKAPQTWNAPFNLQGLAAAAPLRTSGIS